MKKKGPTEHTERHRKKRKRKKLLCFSVYSVGPSLNIGSFYEDR